MGLDDFDSYESPDNSGNTTNTSLEVSEKFKEAVKKAGAKTQKIQKDEKKAKKYDFLLASFLVKIILDKRYDDLLGLLLACIDKGYPSNFLLGVFSLVYIDISKKIRETSNKKIFDFYYVSPEFLDFDDNSINSEIRDRINLWVEDMIDVVLTEGSEITTKKLIDLIDSERKVLEDYFIGVFVFFFKSINITISEAKAFNYIDFIITELKKSYRDYYFSLSVEE